MKLFRGTYPGPPPPPLPPPDNRNASAFRYDPIASPCTCVNLQVRVDSGKYHGYSPTRQVKSKSAETSPAAKSEEKRMFSQARYGLAA